MLSTGRGCNGLEESVKWPAKSRFGLVVELLQHLKKGSSAQQTQLSIKVLCGSSAHVRYFKIHCFKNYSSKNISGVGVDHGAVSFATPTLLQNLFTIPHSHAFQYFKVSLSLSAGEELCKREHPHNGPMTS